MAKSTLRLVRPTTEKRTVTPRRRPNAELRTREHLTEREVERLIEAAKANRHGHRDATMILLAYRHGLRASELVDLRWDQVDFNRAVLHVRRVKQGTPATHPLTGLEMRALRKLQRESEASPFVFVSERGAPFSTAGFARMLERLPRLLGSKSKFIRTCCGTPAGSSSPTTASIPGPCRPISVTRTFSTRSATPSWRRPGSRVSGRTNVQAVPVPADVLA